MTTDTIDGTEAGATTWQESISELSSLLNNNNNSSSSSDTVKIEKTASAILLTNNNTSNNNDGIPASIAATVASIYLRALIKLGKYSTVVNYCKEDNNSAGAGNNAQEFAYALYRLRKYGACSELCSANINTSSNGGDVNANGNNSVNVGLMHIYAQSLYRLGETKQADAIYRQLVSFMSNNDIDNIDIDIDEQEDTLSNALANNTANHTPGSSLGLINKSWVEDCDAFQRLLNDTDKYYGNGDDDGDGDGGENNMLQNYDLAYNLATYLLITGDGRNSSSIVKAKKVLEAAESSALTILESSSTAHEHDSPPQAQDGLTPTTVEEQAARKKKLQQQQQQQALAEREAGPIRANLALAKLLLGGQQNETEALRAYLTIVTKHATSLKLSKSNKKGGGNVSSTVVEGNLLATASNNLAVLRDGKESMFDVMKRIPTTSALSVSEENSNVNVGGKSSDKHNKGKSNSATTSASASSMSMVPPLVGATPQQVRIALFNRALLYAKMGNVNGCMQVLEVLRASLLVSYHGDDVKKSDAPSSPKRGGGGGSNKGKKNKGSASSSVVGGQGSDVHVPTAKPASASEISAWNARANWLESEVHRIAQTKDTTSSSSSGILDKAIANLDRAIKNASGNDDDEEVVLAFTKAQLSLHKMMVNNPKMTEASIVETLESLPASIQSLPGTIVTVALLHDTAASSSSSTNKGESILKSLGDGIQAKLAMAEYQMMSKGNYKAAVELLTGIVEEDGNLEATAMLVKALSYTDPSKAEDYVGVLHDAVAEGNNNGSEMDGEALESMDIPRFAKLSGVSGSTASGGEGGSSSNKVRKMIAATGGKGRSTMG